MTGTMRAAVYQGAGRIAVEPRQIRAPGPVEVLIRVEACGLCGTDVHILDGQYPAMPGVVLGHEYAGVIVEVGPEVQGVKPGDAVAVDPNLSCGTCPPCRRGHVHLCERLQAFGVTRDGGFAEMCRLPASQVHSLPDGLGFESWAFAEPLSCCLHGLDLAGVRPGDRVAILGAGPIGLIMTQLAREAGAAFVLVADPVAAKRDLALQLGADEAVDPGVQDVSEMLRGHVSEGADVVLECVGTPYTTAHAIHLARRGGTIVWFGVCPPGATIPIEPYAVYQKELTIRGAFTNPHTFARAVTLLAQGRIRPEPLISHRFGLADTAHAIETVKAGHAIKALVLPQESWGAETV